MSPEPRVQFRQLPLIPADLLRRHHVFERYDNRFKASARLLQALWREAQQLPMGTHERPGGRQCRIGSLLSSAAAHEGRNFLSPEIAHIVRHETVYRERGALIDQRRLYGNLLSSMPLAFNVFAPLRLNPCLAAKVVRFLIPDIDLARVLDVSFEHSPGRNSAEFTDDQTAFDVAVRYQRSDGELGLLAIEMKFTETGSEGGEGLTHRYDELAAASELYKNPMSAVLRTGLCQQLSREHLLTFTALHRTGIREARFMLIAPGHNHLVQQGAQLYASHLSEPDRSAVPFLNVELESVVEALGRCGSMEHAHALHDRYLDYSKLDSVVEEALRAKVGSWKVTAPSVRRPIALVSHAA